MNDPLGCLAADPGRVPRRYRAGSTKEYAVTKPGNALFSSAVKCIELSASNRASELARTLVARGVDVVNLTVGEPDFDTPEDIRDAAFAAIQRGETRYTSIHGTPALKAAVIEKFRRDNGLSYDLANIAVSAGAKQIIYNAFVATIDPGDEVIVPRPCYVSYPQMVKLVGGTVRDVSTIESDYNLPLERIGAAITPRTKWIVLNSPNNPTGAVYSRDELAGLADILRSHEFVYVLSDDVYEHLVFDNGQFHSLAQVAPDLQNRVLVINSMSKAYSMTGCRLGFAAGPEDLVREMAKVQSQSTAAPCSISQAAAVAGLSGTLDVVRERTEIFQQRRDFFFERLNKIPGLKPNRPSGAFFILLDCSAFFDRKAPNGNVLRNDTDFAEFLLEQSAVATIPGEPYGISTCVRLSFATAMERLEEAGDRIEKACRALH